MIADDLRRNADHFIDLKKLESKVGRAPSERSAVRDEEDAPEEFYEFDR